MSVKRVAVLGAGLVGRLIIEDLLEDEGLAVLAVDGDEGALSALPEHPRLKRRRSDLGDAGVVASLLGGADLGVGAVPGRLGRQVQTAALAARRPLVDIAFAPEDPLDLADDARRAGVALVVDCGLAPGLSNLLAGREAAAMERVEAVRILVGGLPAAREWPWEYRFVFSPGDVIEEYTRPSRLRRRGEIITRPALSEVEPVPFESLGTLEAFLTDGLRTLLHTLSAPDMEEKTLRYPGHAERMRALRDSGFFDTAPVRLEGGAQVAPRAVTEALFRRVMARRPGDAEFTVMRVEVAGDGRHVTWDLHDATDERGRTSMARTTAFPCTAMVRHLAAGRSPGPGVHPPERLDAAAGDAVLAHLSRRGVGLERSERVGPLSR